MSDDLIFRTYDRAGLDREYDNRAKVPEAGSIVERWYSDGQTAVQSMSCRLDIPYGPHERQRLDVFPAAASGSPLLAFIHGGYWHSRDRAMMHFLAPFYVAAGVSFASIGYRLCPEVGIGDIVADIGEAIAWLHANADMFSADGNRLFVAGHSAGGHLAALMCGSAGPGAGVIRGGCSISGLHDLEPIRLCYLNENLNLDAGTAAQFSPIQRIHADAPDPATLPPLIAAVGGREGPEYFRQRDDLVAALRAAGQPVQPVDVPDGDHFTACAAFADPAHVLQESMVRLIFAPRFALP